MMANPQKRVLIAIAIEGTPLIVAYDGMPGEGGGVVIGVGDEDFGPNFHSRHNAGLSVRGIGEPSIGVGVDGTAAIHGVIGGSVVDRAAPPVGIPKALGGGGKPSILRPSARSEAAQE